jgi:protein-S-isoprenylcysteine O-methyltransferase Ste14
MSGYEQSIADVIRSTVQDAQDLVRSEIALAKAELRSEVKRLGAGVAALAAAGLAALVAVILLLTAAAWGIPAALGWPVWSGFALVGAVMLLAAAALAMMGRKRLNSQRHMPLTVDTLKENMKWTRARMS